jgi:ABC-type multidrug transport system fused ATPase/permease subunit
MALSAYRIMPSMTRLNGQIMELRGNYYLLNAIEEAIIAWSKNTDNPDCANYVPMETAKVQWKQIHISLKQVTVGYQSLPSPILTDVQCEFGPGKVHAIVGPSGSGKSTLINAILGLHPLKSGTIELTQSPINVNSSISSMPLKSWLSHIGYLSQHPFLFSGSLRENLTMRVPNMVVDEIQFEKLIEHLGLTDCLGKTPLDFNLFEGGNNLSGGQQQRIAILRALRMDRPVLILDEATSALDGSKRDAVFELLRNRANSGTNVILVTHDISLAKQCDTLLDLGNAHEQPVQRILEKEKT